MPEAAMSARKASYQKDDVAVLLLLARKLYSGKPFSRSRAEAVSKISFEYHL